MTRDVNHTQPGIGSNELNLNAVVFLNFIPPEEISKRHYKWGFGFPIRWFSLKISLKNSFRKKSLKKLFCQTLVSIEYYHIYVP